MLNFVSSIIVMVWVNIISTIFLDYRGKPPKKIFLPKPIFCTFAHLPDLPAVP